ncbi:hypothetical protein ALC56_05418, partial [Trachymyrmex septentrionalis]
VQIEQSLCYSFGHFVERFMRLINFFAIRRKSDNITSSVYISYRESGGSVPNSCSAVSTTSMIKSDGWIRLMTPSSLSTLDKLSFPEELKPEGRLKAAIKSASHHVTILIAANEACRGKSSLPPLMRIQRGSLKTVCISCIGKRDIGYMKLSITIFSLPLKEHLSKHASNFTIVGFAIVFVYPLAIYKIITFGSRFWRGEPNLFVRCLAVYNISTIWLAKFHS